MIVGRTTVGVCFVKRAISIPGRLPIPVYLFIGNSTGRHGSHSENRGWRYETILSCVCLVYLYYTILHMTGEVILQPP